MIEQFSFEYPLAMVFIVPLILILLLLLKVDFVKLELDAQMKRRIKNYRLLMLIFRTIIFSILLVAIASPFTIEKEIVNGDPYISILIDNTTSYYMFSRHANLVKNLQDRIDTEVEYISPSEYSAIGDSILKIAKSTDNILLISDGQNNYGSDLGDVAIFLGMENKTLHTVRNNPVYHDFSISIDGPSETVTDVENIYTVNLNYDLDDILHLMVYIDGKLKMEKYTQNKREIFSHFFTEGAHEIVAKVINPPEDNYFENNDEFYKVVNVIPKPKVLFVSKKNSALRTLINNFYDVTSTDKIPNNIEDFYAIVLNDINALDISNTVVDRLEEFVDNGNGLLVVGGDNSFDYGNYKGSYLETILPTQAGEGKEIDESKQTINIIFIIDISYGSFGNQEGVAVEKAHAINIIKSLRSTDRIGALAFNQNVYVVSEVVDYDTYRDLITSNIQKLPFGGTSRMGPAIIYATRMLEDLDGSNNIIILSDGHTTNRPNANVEDNVDGEDVKGGQKDGAAMLARSKGIRIFTLGVPQDRLSEPINVELMQSVARLTGGTYELASKANTVVLEFGQEKDREDDKISTKGLSLRETGHFITTGLKLTNADISGFNTIVPKSTARTLVTTTQGYPIVTSWRYGLGRVISYTSDDGEKWAGNLLNKDNSKLLLRTVAYAVGDPKRKEKEFIEIPDTEVSKESEIIVKSETFPNYNNLTFSMIEPNIYLATFTPEFTGINELLNKKFAVNYPKEYLNTGINEYLYSIAIQTGGRTFEPDDVDGIIQQARDNAKKLVSNKVYYRWVLIAFALGIFLLELALRRLFSNRRKI